MSLAFDVLVSLTAAWGLAVVLTRLAVDRT